MLYFDAYGMIDKCQLSGRFHVAMINQF